MGNPRYTNPELVQRCRRFWHRETTDRPLIGVLVERIHPLRRFRTGKDSSEVLPEDLAVDVFLAECDRRHEASAGLIPRPEENRYGGRTKFDEERGPSR